MKEIYRPRDIRDLDYARDLGPAGAFPYTRGIYPDMYRGKLWTMRQYSGYATAEESNRRYKFLLKQGQTGLSVAFDLPTQMGFDSDHPMAQGEVGRTGVAVSSLEDIEALFLGIPLDKVSTSMTINATAAILLAGYIVAAEKQGIRPAVLRGTVQNDILKEYIARGTYIFPPGPSMRLVMDVIEYCNEHLPKWNTISISGYHIREAGSNAVQEVAFTLANGIAYVEQAIKRGLDVNSFSARLSFFFNCHNDFFEEIAKFRAARRLWARFMKERFGVNDPAGQRLRFHTQTAGCTLQAQDPLNNTIRVALQALAAVLGGTQSLHTNSYDEALALPGEESAKLALRTQQIIAFESGVSEVVDPAGGSYYLERRTRDLELAVADYIRRIDEMGGALGAIKNGFFKKEIEESAYQQQRAIEEKKKVVVGVNEFRSEEAVRIKTLRVNPRVQRARVEKLKTMRRRRDRRKVSASLDRLRHSARSKTNLMEPILECVRCQATLGEICDVLRGVFGIYQES